MGFQTMGRRRPLSRFMFRVAFLNWMASTIDLSVSEAHPHRKVHPLLLTPLPKDHDRSPEMHEG